MAFFNENHEVSEIQKLDGNDGFNQEALEKYENALNIEESDINQWGNMENGDFSQDALQKYKNIFSEESVFEEEVYHMPTDSISPMEQNDAPAAIADRKETAKSEVTEVRGGSYRDLKKFSDGELTEVHHMPADSISFLETNDGPAIIMDKGDHRQTASYGNSKDAREYRERQKELIEEGKFQEAIQMDIDDIHEKFGDKYDDAISQMLDYVKELEKGGKI